MPLDTKMVPSQKKRPLIIINSKHIEINSSHKILKYPCGKKNKSASSTAKNKRNKTKTKQNKKTKTINK